MGNTQTRQTKAVAVLKRLSIFLCSSYFHRAANTSALFGLLYDNVKCIKFMTNDFNL